MKKQSRIVTRKIAKHRKKPFLNINFKKLNKVLALFFGIVFVFLVFVWLLVNSHKRRMVFVTPLSDGNVLTNVFSTERNSLTSFEIPAETLVKASRDLGVWRIKSIWRLSVDEKLYGQLLSETVTKSLRFPVDSWGDENLGRFLTSKSIKDKFLILFARYRSNLSFFDRANLFLFFLTNRRTIVDLSGSPFLAEAVLPDGDNGFKISNSTNQSDIVSAFVDPFLASKNSSVSIFNQGDLSIDRLNNVGMVLEIMGAKVLGSFDKNPLDFNCRVEAGSNDIAERISKVFGCTTQITPGLGQFEIKLYLGKSFVL